MAVTRDFYLYCTPARRPQTFSARRPRFFFFITFWLMPCGRRANWNVQRTYARFLLAECYYSGEKWKQKNYPVFAQITSPHHHNNNNCCIQSVSQIPSNHGYFMYLVPTSTRSNNFRLEYNYFKRFSWFQTGKGLNISQWTDREAPVWRGAELFNVY